MKAKECEVCGKTYMAINARSLYCSPECKQKAHVKQAKNTRDFRKTRKSKMTIEEINTKALAEHLSYGQYVAKYGL